MSKHLILDLPFDAAIVIEGRDGKRYLSAVVPDGLAEMLDYYIVAKAEKDLPEDLKDIHRFLGVEYGETTDKVEAIKPAPIGELDGLDL